MNSFQTKYFGFPHICLDTVDSTNKYAHKLISKSNPIEGTAISAVNQTAGRGQIGRMWQGEADKNIYTSIILKPSFIKPTDQFLINQAISIGLCDFCSKVLDKRTLIKWPNDIYINNNKLCGILIQYILSGNTINYGVIGIGINVNQEKFPPELPNPTSLYLIKGKQFNIKELQLELFRHLEYYYEKLRVGKSTEIREKYLSLLYMLNEECLFLINGKYIFGTIVGVEHQGRLRLKTPNGTSVYNLNELKMVIENQQL